MITISSSCKHQQTTVVSCLILLFKRERLHQSTRSTFNKSLMVSVSVSKLGQTQLIACLSILQWRSMAHTTVTRFSLDSYCLSCRRSRETSSSCSKTLLQCRSAPHMRHNQTSCTGDTRVHCTRTVAPNSQDIFTQWTTRYGAKCSSGYTRQNSWPGWTEAASYRCVAWLGMLGQNIIDDAIDEWRKRLRACIRNKGGHLDHLFWLKGTHVIT